MKKILIYAVLAAMLSSCVGIVKDRSEEFPDLKEIVVVYKTHFDIGYSDFAHKVVDLYRGEMISDTLDIIKQYKNLPPEKQFVWTVPGWPMQQMLWDGQDSAKKAAIESYIKSGNLVVHALPFTSHTATMDMEEVVRGLEYSADIARKYGLELPRGAKTTDVPAQSWILPTVLKNAGIDFYQIGVNDATTAPEAPYLFNWEGPDGSKLLTLLTNTYGTWKVPPKNWKYSSWIAILATGDNCGPPSSKTLADDLAYFEKAFPNANVKVGRLEDFYDALTDEDLEKVPTVKGDMADCWIHGVASNPRGAVKIAKARPEIRSLEFLSTLNTINGLSEESANQAVKSAYEKSILWSEHTWGLASQAHIHFDYNKDKKAGITRALPVKGGERPTPYGAAEMEASWAEHEKYGEDAGIIAGDKLNKELKKVADSVSVSGKKVIVFNQLSFSRDSEVCVSVPFENGAVLLKTLDGSTLNGYVADGLLEFTAIDLPSMGYRTYEITETGLEVAGSKKIEINNRQNNLEIVTPLFKITADKARGELLSIVNTNGLEMINQESEIPFGYYYERFCSKETVEYAKTALNPGWINAPHGDMHCRSKIPSYQEKVVLGLKADNYRTEIIDNKLNVIFSGKLDGPVEQDIELTYSIYTDKPVIYIKVSADNKGKVDAWPEACWISVPLKINNPQFRAGRLGGAMNPAEDFFVDSSRMSFWSKDGAAVFNRNGGASVSSAQSQLISLGVPGVAKFDGNYVPTKSSIFVNLQNNIWHTNFCDWWSGKIESNVRVTFFDKYDNSDVFVEGSRSYRYPASAFYSDSKGGNAPAEAEGIKLSVDGSIVTAFYKTEKGIILRIWEQSGKGGAVKVSLPAKSSVSEAVAVDLRNEPTGKVFKVKNNSFSFDIGAWAPATFILK
jgi:hypothetical protein